MKIPEGISVDLEQDAVKIRGELGSVEKKFDSRVLLVERKGNEITVKTRVKATRKTSAAAGALEAHLRNAFEGVAKGFEKRLVIVFAHFPITVEVSGKQVVVKNFLGEKLPRTAAIVGDTRVEVKGQDIFVRGADSEAVGQTAANLIASTKIHEKDVRRFQDGIYEALEGK